VHLQHGADVHQDGVPDDLPEAVPHLHAEATAGVEVHDNHCGRGLRCRRLPVFILVRAPPKKLVSACSPYA